MMIFFRQAPQEFIEAFGILTEIRRQLPEHDSDAFLQRFNPGEVLSHRAIEIGHALHMRDEPAPLYRKDKTWRRFVAPAPHHIESREPIERGIDLHCGKLRRIEFKLPGLRNILWIELLLPTLVRPTAGSYVNFAHQKPSLSSI